jgi:mono/diheme cytochrome c family protein
MRRRLDLALVAATTLLASGCTQIDNLLASVPIFAFLRESPSFDPYEAPRPAPIGSVPFSSPAGESQPLIPLTPTGLAEFAAGPHGQDPLPPGDTAVLRLGQVMFDRYCVVCHGPQGQADGTILGEGKYPAPLTRNLTAPAAVGLADGMIYGIIRNGRGLMPAYGPRTNVTERWAIVRYVRSLQQSAGGAPPPAAAPAQGVPGAADTTGAAAAADTTGAAAADTTGAAAADTTGDR